MFEAPALTVTSENPHQYPSRPPLYSHHNFTDLVATLVRLTGSLAVRNVHMMTRNSTTGEGMTHDNSKFTLKANAELAIRTKT